MNNVVLLILFIDRSSDKKWFVAFCCTWIVITETYISAKMIYWIVSNIVFTIILLMTSDEEDCIGKWREMDRGLI